MKSLTTVLFITTLAFATTLAAETQNMAADAFERLQTLTGTWKVKGKEDSKFSIQFELTANKTVLVETWMRGEKKHSYTMYHLDNDKLLATHYCPQGNQPRLRLSKTSNTTPNATSLTFNFHDATNIKGPNHSRQHSLGFELTENENQIVRKESYLSGKGENFSSLNLVRL